MDRTHKRSRQTRPRLQANIENAWSHPPIKMPGNGEKRNLAQHGSWRCRADRGLGDHEGGVSGKVLWVAAPAVCATLSLSQPDKRSTGPWVIIVETAPQITARTLALSPTCEPSNAVQQVPHVNEQSPRIHECPVGEAVIASGARCLVSLDPVGNFFRRAAEKLRRFGNVFSWHKLTVNDTTIP